MLNTYKDWEEEYINGFRNIIELMINENYVWTNADGNIRPRTRYVRILLMYSDLPPANFIWMPQAVSFGYDNWFTNWYLYPLEEVKRDYFWQWLEVSEYLVRPRKTIDEHIYAVTDRTIWEVAKYVRENVLVRNVKLFK